MVVFLDANILFSAANPSSPLRRLLGNVHGRGRVVTSHLAVEEARRNLALKRPHWTDGFESLMKEVAVVSAGRLDERIDLADKDRPLLGSAIAASCTHFLTGDRGDFGHLIGKSNHGLTVLTPVDLAKELEG